jgi:hypothetical protein
MFLDVWMIRINLQIKLKKIDGFVNLTGKKVLVWYNRESRTIGF